MITEADIYKHTYNDLVQWLKILINDRRHDQTVYDRNIWQARRIMELEFDLQRRKKYDMIMLEDQERQVVDAIGVEDNIVSIEEYKDRGLSLIQGGRGSFNGDWLTPLPWGTQFYVRPKVQKTWMLAKFLKAGAKKSIVYLVPMKGAEDVVIDDREWIPVEPKAFSAFFELVEKFTEKDNE